MTPKKRAAAEAFKQQRRRQSEIKGIQPKQNRARTPVKKRRSKPRRGRVRDPRRLAFIAEQPCLVTGEWPVTVHHVRRYGEPKNDHRAVPLVARLHMLTSEKPGEPCVERLGRLGFEKYYGVDFEAAIERYSRLYHDCHGAI